MELVFHGYKELIFPKNNSCKLHFLLYQRELIELVRHCERKSNKCHQATLSANTSAFQLEVSNT